MGMHDEVLSRLHNLERDFKAIEAQDSQATKTINGMQRSLSAVKKLVDGHLSPSSRVPSLTVADYRVVDLITSAFADIAKKDEKKLAAKLSEFESIALQMKQTVDHLAEIANSHSITAADKLIKAARFFSTSPIGVSAGGAKGGNLVEQAILKAVRQ